ncbi:hypothetical protein COI51_16455 [Bacillus toyonensis]|uniref:hypothetical protein n=1 Tax=Bacillus toyonensis TaxID=155322 RepID=UPI000BF45897|nr:hypothetical protein [Bacillus toyonensis]PGB24894.1 hypothetical protein COM06_19855 [Bacillus toyonensis]PGC34618.1 hypothetical protein COM10_20100 [Bacillus toyonensis]PHF83408.1 hypothetical protein COI51_16455 [Bacillus toyonensis]PHG01151.1 hypothetical protein COI49_19585 [Bacillus toyonensis]
MSESRKLEVIFNTKNGKEIVVRVNDNKAEVLKRIEKHGYQGAMILGDHVINMGEIVFAEVKAGEHSQNGKEIVEAMIGSSESVRGLSQKQIVEKYEGKHL